MIHTAIRWALVALLAVGLVVVTTTPVEGFADPLSPAILSAVAAVGTAIAGVTAAIAALQRANEGKFTETLMSVAQLATGEQTPGATSEVSQYAADLVRLRNAWQNRDSLFSFTSGTGLWLGSLNNAEANTLATRLDALGSLTGSAGIADHWRDATDRADTVTAAQIGNLYRDPVQGQAAVDAMDRMREQAENDRVLDYHTLRFTDAAHWRSVELRERTSELPDGTEAAQLQAEIDLLMVDAALLNASRQAQQNRAGELQHHQHLDRWYQAEVAAHAQNDASIAWIQANAADLGAGLLLPEAFGPR